ncbi:hypothetical protein [Caballeronia sp. LZ032]|uniref:hypothetical protein n=1 Tax=Caballeronia sp. LZ032 TaxID=3038565 RepID=UPI00286441E8|nr:hypothetical protein [Caballeronia sp. LZ032]MDR5881083.1 hypothetical protein [Caballeronia sp. LZ032]
MKERPILFSGPMVRALLDGRKTQTRRVVKPTGAHHIFQFRGKDEARGADEPTGEWAWCSAANVVSNHIRCRYGKPGDRLWLRETTYDVGRNGYVGPVFVESEAGANAAAWGWGESDDPDFIEPYELRKRPAIHMPGAMSRITLEVTGVRVERLDQITEDDAQAEGAPPAWLDVDGETVNIGQPTYRQGFARLWRDINGDVSWASNPWVWVVEFRRV